MHHKFCLIDVLYNEKTSEKNPVKNQHPTEGLIINGSLNWTANVGNRILYQSIDEHAFYLIEKLLLLLQGFMRNWENVTFQSDDYIKNEFKKGFDYIWKRLVPRTQDGLNNGRTSIKKAMLNQATVH